MAPWRLLVPLLLRPSAAQAPLSSYCVADCLGEALAGDPTKGCGAGTFWVPHPRTLPEESCQPCVPGYYCPGTAYGEFGERAVNLNRPVACPTGMALAHYAAETFEECTNCTAGYYQDKKGQTACLGCPEGRFVKENGTKSLDGCEVCFCGHYCPFASAKPTPCPAGTYSPSEGNRQLENCLPCPAGSICGPGTCDPFGCNTCPPGKFSSGSVGPTEQVAGGKVHAVEHDADDEEEGCLLVLDACSMCPAGAFCTSGSALPTSCPPGTISGPGAKSEEDCKDCPPGYACWDLANESWALSAVGRTANGVVIVGTGKARKCEEDKTVIHFSYPNRTGCVEHCPFQLPRQSFCHVAGDGRIPDPGRLTDKISDLIVQRSRDGLFEEETQEFALGNLSEALENMSDAQFLDAVNMPDHHGRTPHILAAMAGDVASLQLLHARGPGFFNISALRDAGGYTAVMHSLQLGYDDVTAWLIAEGGAVLTADDARELEAIGVETASVPRGERQNPPEFLGRGAMGWFHPSGEDFLDPRLTPTTTLTTTFTTTTTGTTTTATVTNTSTTTTTSSTTTDWNETTTTSTTTTENATNETATTTVANESTTTSAVRNETVVTSTTTMADNETTTSTSTAVNGTENATTTTAEAWLSTTETWLRSTTTNATSGETTTSSAEGTTTVSWTESTTSTNFTEMPTTVTSTSSSTVNATLDDTSTTTSGLTVNATLDDTSTTTSEALNETTTTVVSQASNETTATTVVPTTT